MKLRLFSALAFLALVFSSCNSSNSGTVEISVSPAGVWRVQFTELIDECDVIVADDEGVGFISEETVTQDGETFTVSADELVFGFIDGTLRSPSSLIAEEAITGDIFEAGFNCTLSERLAYNDITDTTANIVYEVFIDCDDGTRCDSLFRAQGEKLS